MEGEPVVGYVLWSGWGLRFGDEAVVCAELCGRAVEDELSVRDLGGGFCVFESPCFVLWGVVEGPPCPGFGFGRFVRFQFLELVGGEGDVIDSCVVDGSGEVLFVASSSVAEADRDSGAWAVRLGWVLSCVMFDFFAVSVERDFPALIGDGHLDEGVCFFFGWSRVLVLDGSTPEVASGHPLFGREFAEDDAVEMLVAVFEG